MPVGLAPRSPWVEVGRSRWGRTDDVEPPLKVFRVVRDEARIPATDDAVRDLLACAFERKEHHLIALSARQPRLERSRRG